VSPRPPAPFKTRGGSDRAGDPGSLSERRRLGTRLRGRHAPLLAHAAVSPVAGCGIKADGPDAVQATAEDRMVGRPSPHLLTKASAPGLEPRAPEGGCSEGFLCMSSLKERGRSIPVKKIVWVLCAVPSVQVGSRQPADRVRVERPQRSEDERPWDRQGLMQDGSGGGSGCLVDGLLRAGIEVGGSSIASDRWRWAARVRVPVIPSPRQAAWSCAAAAGRAQSSGRPRRWAGVMTDTSTRRAAPELFTSPPWTLG
jgi:hypothetical protein